MFRDDAFAACMFLALSAVLATEAFHYPVGGSLRKVGPGFFPLLCLAFLALFSTVLLVRSLKCWRLNLRADWPSSMIPGVMLLAAIGAYGLILPRAGFLLTTFAFSFLLFWHGYPRRWMLILVGAAATSLVSVLVFEIWLKIQFPRGLIGV